MKTKVCLKYFVQNYSLYSRSEIQQIICIKRASDKSPFREPDEKVIYFAASYIQYEQLRLHDTYKQYFKIALLTKKVVQARIQNRRLKNHTGCGLVLNQMHRLHYC